MTYQFLTSVKEGAAHRTNQLQNCAYYNQLTEEILHGVDVRIARWRQRVIGAIRVLTVVGCRQRPCTHGQESAGTDQPSCQQVRLP